jgi:hypothetical protein
MLVLLQCTSLGVSVVLACEHVETPDSPVLLEGCNFFYSQWSQWFCQLAGHRVAIYSGTQFNMLVLGFQQPGCTQKVMALL